MMRVRAGGTIIAETPVGQVVNVEGNPYFPPSALKETFTKPSSHRTVCGWKGTASYLDIVTDGGDTISNVIWYYPEPKEAALNIKGYYAFYGSKVDIKQEDS